MLIETYHYKNEEIDRDYITGLIKEVCEEDLAVKREAPNAYRIGIDFGTLQDLGLDIKDVEEKYKTENKHLKPLERGGKLAGLYPKEWIDYITSKRIEINSVTEALNDNEKFWNWIVGKNSAITHRQNNGKHTSETVKLTSQDLRLK